MDKFMITVAQNEDVYHFEVLEYLHHDGERCKFEIFNDGKFVAGLEPDDAEYLKICKNPGHVDKEVIHLIVDQLESYNL